MVEGARLESVCTLTGTVGSNPTLSAINLLPKMMFFLVNIINRKLKLKTFAHFEFAHEKFSSIQTIKNKIDNRIDLFGRGHKYKVIKIDSNFPDYLIKNINKFKDFIEN